MADKTEQGEKDASGTVPENAAAALAAGDLTTADLPREAVGTRAYRLAPLSQEALDAAIHTDRALDPLTFLPDMDVLGGGMFDRVLDAAET